MYSKRFKRENFRNFVVFILETSELLIFSKGRFNMAYLLHPCLVMRSFPLSIDTSFRRIFRRHSWYVAFRPFCQRIIFFPHYMVLPSFLSNNWRSPSREMLACLSWPFVAKVIGRNFIVCFSTPIYRSPSVTFLVTLRNAYVTKGFWW